MSVDHVETVGYGMYKRYRRRTEKVVRITKTLVVTDFSRYDKKTGADVDLVHKSIGGFRLSEESIAAVNSE